MSNTTDMQAWARTLLPAAVVIAMAAAAALYVFNPEDTWWMPQCAFHRLTGWQCPGCGLLRAIHSLLRMRPAEALAYNYFLLVSAPMAAALAYTTLSRSARARRMEAVVQSPGAVRAFAALMLLWWITRNILNI